jgi:hypothetical protein
MRINQADALEAFVDESLRLFATRDYFPMEFKRMRQIGTILAIERLVRSTGEIQSGFRRIQKLGMLERSMEATVLKFPERFTEEVRKCAEFRLNYGDDEALRTR